MVTTSPNCMPFPLSSSSSSPAAAKSSSSSSISRRAYWPIPVSARPSSNIACDCELSSLKSSHSRNWVVCSAVEVNNLSSSPSTSSPEDNIGSRVRVKVPLKVYHIPKVPEFDLTGMEGEIKQYVGLWKGKRISANLPYKVEFVTEIPGRGPVKFVAHLKEDEFEYI
ncbi:Ferredoxin-thioredoxin reductase, variable chain [Senna tora]|uniref:Ferredoxin-thioredoxin reductase, variable chain n=1 Tax=Senna tora TaxID=362788 RepID=A0A834STQ5_9FABA|nr:Ferredoxin-thioredoxin reductase, variable chain [Senna tora]